MRHLLPQRLDAPLRQASFSARINVRNSYIYIMTGRSDTLYTGVTSALEKRVSEHKDKTIDGFTRRYNLNLSFTMKSTKTSQRRSRARSRSRAGLERRRSC